MVGSVSEEMDHEFTLTDSFNKLVGTESRKKEVIDISFSCFYTVSSSVRPVGRKMRKFIR